MIDTGDIPGHQVRIMEIHRTPSNSTANCEGLKIVESWNRGYSDYINGNDRAWGYRVYILENGDKIFAQYSDNSHTTLNSDGSKKGTYTGVYVITGGTGKYRGIQGTGRELSNFDIYGLPPKIKTNPKVMANRSACSRISGIMSELCEL